MKITFSKPIDVQNPNEAMFMPSNFNMDAAKLNVVGGGTSVAKSWNNIVFEYSGTRYRISANSLYLKAKAELKAEQLKKLFDIKPTGAVFLGEIKIGFKGGIPFFAAN